jgi:ABC-2 type transport system permease protein
MAMSLPLALTVFWLGNPDVGKILTGFLGIFLLGLAYLSVGVFCSSLSYQSMVGFLVSSVVLITNNLLGQEMLLIRIPAGWREAVSYLSLDWHARQFSQGIISVKDSVFFVSWIVIFLVATGLVLKARGK